MVTVTSLFELDPEKVGETIESLKSWIRQYFDQTGGKIAVLGMSGGKDSTVCAKLLVDTLGADNVIGVFMPNGEQKDIEDARAAARAAGLTRTELVNIAGAYEEIALSVPGFSRTSPSGINLAPRLRMTTLYAIAQTFQGGRVCCTGNLSEALVGYCTLFGDLAGDFAPLANVFKEDVCIIGKALGLPEYLVDKVPSDGLSGQSDEDKLGFTYADIRERAMGRMDPESDVAKRIDSQMKDTYFKGWMVHIPSWNPCE